MEKTLRGEESTQILIKTHVDVEMSIFYCKSVKVRTRSKVV